MGPDFRPGFERPLEGKVTLRFFAAGASMADGADLVEGIELGKRVKSRI